MRHIIELTQVNEAGFDPVAVGLDLDHFRPYNVTKVIESRSEGHLVYRKVEIEDCEREDPGTDLLLAGTVKRSQVVESGAYRSTRNTNQPRAVWDGKLWRIMDDDQLKITSVLYGVDPEELATASRVLTEQFLARSIVQEASFSGWKMHK